jgi:hypothetical protein
MNTSCNTLVHKCPEHVHLTWLNLDDNLRISDIWIFHSHNGKLKRQYLTLPRRKLHVLMVTLGFFFSCYWDIVRQDLLNAVNQLFILNRQGLHFLNQAFAVVIPKKENPQKVADYRTISLTNSFAKIMTKILANRLGAECYDLISINQSSFIKGRCIQLCLFKKSSRIYTRGSFNLYLLSLIYPKLLTL